MFSIFPDPIVPESIKTSKIGSKAPNGDDFENALKLSWDRGHLVPNNDMSTKDTKASTFNVVNRAPQLSTLNRGPWRSAEMAIRRFNLQSKSTLVVVTYLEYQRLKVDTVPEEHKGATVAIPLKFHKVIYVDADTKKSEISEFKSAACVSLSNRDPKDHPSIASWSSCPKELTSQLPKPKDTTDASIEQALKSFVSAVKPSKSFSLLGFLGIGRGKGKSA
jgi:hypothetical protein